MTKKVEIILPISKPGPGTMGETGEWRIYRPILDPEKCIFCLQCVIACPDSIIDTDWETERQPGKKGIVVWDYQYCKGCLLCVQVCPKEAISTVREEGR